MTSRYDRNERLFGVEGQAKLRAAQVAVVGVGGLGMHVVQQVSLLGIGALSLIEDERLDVTNLNRYPGVVPDDVGALKVDLGARLASGIDPTLPVQTIKRSLFSAEAIGAVKQADWVFGCLDDDGARLVLTEVCAAYRRSYIDTASDIELGPPVKYGGRVCVARSGDGCPVCLDLLDLNAARESLENPRARRDREAIYGVDRAMLGEAGPAVVSINGVVASLAVTEFMVAVTGLRPPQRLTNYYGHRGMVASNKDQPTDDCYYCKALYGTAEQAGVERYALDDLRLTATPTAPTNVG